MLQVAASLGCSEIADACAGYLEAAPWEEADEEEIIQTIPSLGSQYWSVLARLSPVAPSAVIAMLVSTVRFATSSPPISMSELKKTAQEQLEYMLTEDDDPPLIYSDVPKAEIGKCAKDLLKRFHDFICSLNISQTGILDAQMLESFKSHVSDVAWASQILCKMELMKVMVQSWAEWSADMVKGVEHVIVTNNMPEMAVKLAEITTRVFELVGVGNVVLPTLKRLQMVNVWLPFVQKTRSLLEPADINTLNETSVKLDDEMWQSLESAFVSILLTLPSKDQADILAGWLRSGHVRYPDLSEAFEIWCYRAKVATRRLSWISDGPKRG